MKYFVSFIEEFVMNPPYPSYIMGRIEVYKQDEPYAFDEIRFFTRKVRKFNEFREIWDMKEITKRELISIEQTVKRDYCQFPKR